MLTLNFAICTGCGRNHLSKSSIVIYVQAAGVMSQIEKSKMKKEGIQVLIIESLYCNCNLCV